MTSKRMRAGMRDLPKSEQVLLLVDVINPFDFPDAETLVAGAFHAAQAIAKLKTRLARKKVPTIYANDNYGTWHSEFRDVLTQCLALPGKRAEIARLLAPGAGDLTILKPRHSGFFATPLDLLLREIGAKELVIAGFSTDICVALTAMDAYMHGYQAWVPGDCTAAESETRKRTSLEHMTRVLGCSVKDASRSKK